MSFHHENVIWQSADGTWNRGFYPRFRGFASDDDYDPEWDDDFDYGAFFWVSAGHSSEQEAAHSWDGANPWGYSICTYGPETAALVEEYEDMAAVLCEAESGSRDKWGASLYSGPPKQRTTKAVQAERDIIVEAWVSHHARGYDNDLDLGGRLPKLNADLAERYAKADQTERRAFDDRDAAHRATLRELLAGAREAYVASNQRHGWRYDHGQAQQRSRYFAEVENYIGQLDREAGSRSRPAPKPQAPPKAGQARGKTTPGSTAGSFAPRRLEDPGSNVL